MNFCIMCEFVPPECEDILLYGWAPGYEELAEVLDVLDSPRVCPGHGYHLPRRGDQHAGAGGQGGGVPGVEGGVDEVRHQEHHQAEEEPAGEKHQQGVHLAPHHLVHHADEVVHLLGPVFPSHGPNVIGGELLKSRDHITALLTGSLQDTSQVWGHLLTLQLAKTACLV